MSLLPTSAADRRVRVLAWLSLVANIVIVGTGGAVRLTGSGLGCPTWPYCTDESLVATPEMGIHGVIEFGNRLLSPVLGIIALLTFLSVVRLWRTRRDLVVLSVVLGLGVVAQGVIGGITVLTQLRPDIVGAHFTVSAAIVAVATVYLRRVQRGRPGALAVPAWVRWTTWLLAGVIAVTVYVGVLTTGSGPHAGDDIADRNGLDSVLLQHVHSWPAYAAVALTVLLLAAAVARRFPTLPWLGALLGALAVQVVVGITQSRLGLPELLVGIHMVLACIAVALTAAVVVALRHPADSTPAESQGTQVSAPESAEILAARRT